MPKEACTKEMFFEVSWAATLASSWPKDRQSGFGNILPIYSGYRKLPWSVRQVTTNFVPCPNWESLLRSLAVEVLIKALLYLHPSILSHSNFMSLLVGSYWGSFKRNLARSFGMILALTPLCPEIHNSVTWLIVVDCLGPFSNTVPI